MVNYTHQYTQPRSCHWGEEEIKALVCFVRLFGYTESWPAFGRQDDFWKKVVDFLSNTVRGSNRTGIVGVIRKVLFRWRSTVDSKHAICYADYTLQFIKSN